MSRQDRANRGANRPSTISLAYRLQRSLPYNSELNCYLLNDRKLLDEAAAHILRLEAAVRKLTEESKDASPSN